MNELGDDSCLRSAPVFQNNSNSRGGIDAPAGQAENLRLGFSECEPQTNTQSRDQGPPPPAGDSAQKVLTHSYENVATFKSFLIAPNLFPICSACWCLDSWTGNHLIFSKLINLIIQKLFLFSNNLSWKVMSKFS